MSTVRVAAVQASPVFLDADATIHKAADLMAEAKAEGAQLVVLPEAFVPAWPSWVDAVPPGKDDALYDLLRDQCVVVGGARFDALVDATTSAGVHAVVGVNELDPGGSTIFNTMLYIGPDGYLGRHRKMMPTFSEKLVWGVGDGSDLNVFDTPVGRVGGLICWENYMPLARFALYGKHVDIWCAPTLASHERWVPTLRHIAREGRCIVIGVAPVGRLEDVPDTVPDRESLMIPEELEENEGWLLGGYSAIVDHMGTVLAGPLVNAEGILYADVDVDAARSSRRFFDPVGHYNRPDIFQLTIDERPKPSVTYIGGGTAPDMVATNGQDSTYSTNGSERTVTPTRVRTTTPTS